MIACPNCRTIFPVETANTGRLHACADCRNQLRVDMFNAFHRPLALGELGEHTQVKGQAECFFHPGKMANTPCSSCGRLLCALCEITIDGRTLCTNCLNSGLKKEQIKSIEKDRVLYDSLALHLTIWPLLIFIPMFFFVIVTAPVAIFLTVRHWKTSSSIIPRRKFRFVLAFILAIGELVGWMAMIFSIFS